MDVPAVLMRGGTSKGVFLHQRDLPSPGPGLDRMLLDLMGSPDAMQIDGLGGSHSSTSKVIIVSPSDAAGIDVDYWFAQVPVGGTVVSWSGNCGNLTTAVAPFAIDEGIVSCEGPIANVRLRNRNTGVVIEAKVPIAGGRSVTEGSFEVAGVPGSGAPIATNFLDPVGGVLGSLFPTGARTDRVEGPHGVVDVSILDVTHPYAFVRASELGLRLSPATPTEFAADGQVLERLEQLRTCCADLLGEARGVAVPRLILVDTPGDANGGADLVAAGLSMGRPHHALPLTGALCLAAAAWIEGTVAARLLDGPRAQLRVRHPKGVITVTVDAVDEEQPTIRSVGVVGTARRLLSGAAHLPGPRARYQEPERVVAASVSQGP